MLAEWHKWVTAFDTAAADGDWAALRPLVTDDMRYTVAGAPFGCELDGAEAVLAGFARSIAGFDARFDERRWFGVGVRAFATAGRTGAVTGRAMGWYRRGVLPPLVFSADSVWLFRDGLVAGIVEIYDMGEADTQVALGWLAAHGEGLDPSYR